jgi:phage tail tape-measure protein
MVDSDTSDKAAQAGRTAGTIAGMFTGAKLGNLALPVPILGTFVGGVVGSEAGQRLAKAVVNGAGAFMETLASPQSSSS